VKILTKHMPDDQHGRLKTSASQRGLSLCKLLEKSSMNALEEFDTENRFRIRAAQGDQAKGLAILDELDGKHGTN
jgi:hypothetical protein